MSGESEVWFALAGARVSALVPDVNLATAVRNLFPDYSTEPSAPDAPRRFRLRRSPEGWAVDDVGHDETRDFPSLPDAADVLEYLLAMSLLEGVSHLPHLHASGAVVNDRAIVLLGPPGAGKSTVALKLSARGCPVLGDDVILAGDDERLHPFKRLFDVNARMAPNVPRDPTLARLTDGADIWFDPRSCGGWASPTPPAVVTHLRYEPGAGTTARALEPSAGLNLLLASVLPSGIGADRCFDRLAGYARGARSLEMAFGDAAEAADVLVSMVG